jgi:hypothetical protein
MFLTEREERNSLPFLGSIFRVSQNLNRTPIKPEPFDQSAIKLRPKEFDHPAIRKAAGSELGLRSVVRCKVVAYVFVPLRWQPALSFSSAYQPTLDRPITALIPEKRTT